MKKRAQNTQWKDGRTQSKALEVYTGNGARRRETVKRTKIQGEDIEVMKQEKKMKNIEKLSKIINEGYTIELIEGELQMITETKVPMTDRMHAGKVCYSSSLKTSYNLDGASGEKILRSSITSYVNMHLEIPQSYGKFVKESLYESATLMNQTKILDLVLELITKLREERENRYEQGSDYGGKQEMKMISEYEEELEEGFAGMDDYHGNQEEDQEEDQEVVVDQLPTTTRRRTTTESLEAKTTATREQEIRDPSTVVDSSSN